MGSDTEDGEWPSSSSTDACVLYPAPLRDLLVRLANTEVVRARWSETILDECFRNILEQRPRWCSIPGVSTHVWAPLGGPLTAIGSTMDSAFVRRTLSFSSSAHSGAQGIEV